MGGLGKKYPLFLLFQKSIFKRIQTQGKLTKVIRRKEKKRILGQLGVLTHDLFPVRGLWGDGWKLASWSWETTSILLSHEHMQSDPHKTPCKLEHS